MSNTFFRKASLDSISSPEQLNDYIKVSNPSIWTVLISLCIFLVAVLFWGFTGGLPTSINTTGIIRDAKALTYISVEDAEDIKVGQKVIIKIAGQGKTLDGLVDIVQPIPMSPVEIASELQSDYLLEAIAPKGFGIKVIISVEEVEIIEGTLINLDIISDIVRPIDFILN